MYLSWVWSKGSNFIVHSLMPSGIFNHGQQRRKNGMIQNREGETTYPWSKGFGIYHTLVDKSSRFSSSWWWKGFHSHPICLLWYQLLRDDPCPLSIISLSQTTKVLMLWQSDSNQPHKALETGSEINHSRPLCDSLWVSLINTFKKSGATHPFVCFTSRVAYIINSKILIFSTSNTSEIK